MRVAFYAPAKPPDHEVPSGDRTMACLLIAALQMAGYEVTLASQLRTYSAEPAPGAREQLEQAAGAEVRRLMEGWGTGKVPTPDCWFCYHPYYKSPDWIGPAVCHMLGLPYVTAEASYARKRDAGQWAVWQEAAAASIRGAALNFWLTERDLRGLEAVPERRGRLVHLPPFIDCNTSARSPGREPDGTLRLVTVAMMRPGTKLQSYRLLAQALANLQDVLWTLTIVGDGPKRAAVGAAFAAISPDRLFWRGALPPKGVRTELRAADLFVWPGCGEAYGVSYLEAQAEGLPVVAQATAGVPSVVRHDETGFLTPEGDVDAFGAAIRRLAGEAALRERMGKAASSFVRNERSLPHAARILNAALETLCRQPRRT